MKKIFLIIMLFILSGCGYSSIYDLQNSQMFQIIITEIQGDNEFNGFLKNELNLYSNTNTEKKYFINVNSSYKKNIISKNSSGVATNFNLLLSTNIQVSINESLKDFKFEESINIKNNTNSFEQKNYERNIKRNFASSIKEKLINKILDINDN